MKDETKIMLSEEEIPTAWYNIQADLPKPLEPYLHPQTTEPVDLALPPPLYAAELSKQESSTERWIDIPGKIIDIYKLYRPTPLFRAKRLEATLDTPANILLQIRRCQPTGEPQAQYCNSSSILCQRTGGKADSY